MELYFQNSINLQGGTNGIISDTNFSYYDGIVKGIDGTINDLSKIVDTKILGMAYYMVQNQLALAFIILLV